jgi:hypothetical protein
LVASAVTIWPAATLAGKAKEKGTVPAALVVTLAAAISSCPSGMPPSGSGLLAKISIR